MKQLLIVAFLFFTACTIPAVKNPTQKAFEKRQEAQLYAQDVSLKVGERVKVPFYFLESTEKEVLSWGVQYRYSDKIFNILKYEKGPAQSNALGLMGIRNPRNPDGYFMVATASAYAIPSGEAFYLEIEGLKPGEGFIEMNTNDNNNFNIGVPKGIFHPLRVTVTP